ncbi:hypothetical protein FACS189454_02420 [Planctomycetales bacterium]|nr:hypothetical protein FACS189454_02420 [Planctomycetales bacterium]
MIPTPDQLGLYYPSKDLSVSGTDLPDRTASSNCTSTTIVTDSLPEASDYWNGAIGFFCGTATAVLRGQTFHVKAWDKNTNTLSVSAPLPAVPVSGDTFKLFIGGKTASSQEVLAMKVSGKQPEADTVTGTNISGLTIRKASALLGEGTLSIVYTNSAATNRTIKIRMGSDDYGPEAALSENITGLVLFDKKQAGFIIVDIVYSSLPTASKTDTFTLTIPKGNLIPNFEGYETNDGFGRTRYHLVVAKNLMDLPSDVMNALTIWTGKPAGVSTTLTSGSYALNYSTPMLVGLTAHTDWPTRGFWVRNKTKNDLRYVDYRNGNVLYTKIVDWGFLAFRNAALELARGLRIDNSASAPSISAVIDQVFLESGTWEAGNAAGTLILKKYTGTGTLGATTTFYVNGTAAGVAGGTSYRGYRGKQAQGWSAGDTVTPISDIDIGINDPTDGFFKDPPNENVAPDGVKFGLYPAQNECLTVDYLSGGSSIGIWLRQTIVDGTQARENIIGDLNFCWF